MYFYYLPNVTPAQTIKQTPILATDDTKTLTENPIVLFSNTNHDFSCKNYDVAFVRASDSLKRYIMRQIKTSDYAKDVIAIVEYYLTLSQQITQKLSGKAQVLCDAYFYDFCIVAEQITDDINAQVNDFLNSLCKDSLVDHSKTDAIFARIEKGIKESHFTRTCKESFALTQSPKDISCTEEELAELALLSALNGKRIIEINAHQYAYSDACPRWSTLQESRFYSDSMDYTDACLKLLTKQCTHSNPSHDKFWTMVFSNTAFMNTLIPLRSGATEQYNTMTIYPVFASNYTTISTSDPVCVATLPSFKIHTIPTSYHSFFNHLYEYLWNVIASLKFNDEMWLWSNTMIELFSIALKLTSNMKLWPHFKRDIVSQAPYVSPDKLKSLGLHECSTDEINTYHSPLFDFAYILNELRHYFYYENNCDISEFYSDIITSIHNFFMFLRSDVITCNLLDFSLKDYVEFMISAEDFATTGRFMVTNSTLWRFAVVTKYLYSKENNVCMLDVDCEKWQNEVKSIIEGFKTTNNAEICGNLKTYIDYYVELNISEKGNDFVEKGKSVLEQKVMPLISCWENDSKCYAKNEHMKRHLDFYRLYTSKAVNPVILEAGFRMLFRDYWYYFGEPSIALNEAANIANSFWSGTKTERKAYNWGSTSEIIELNFHTSKFLTAPGLFDDRKICISCRIVGKNITCTKHVSNLNEYAIIDFNHGSIKT